MTSKLWPASWALRPASPKATFSGQSLSPASRGGIGRAIPRIAGLACGGLRGVCLLPGDLHRVVSRCLVPQPGDHRGFGRRSMGMRLVRATVPLPTGVGVGGHGCRQPIRQIGVAGVEGEQTPRPRR